ncbi:multi-sensor hybrid histidine kinase [Stanieria sp. NIES-3757]|nr:multi-sensor hybrid histidine kinase [Stanieria sp. NIES-3757]
MFKSRSQVQSYGLAITVTFLALLLMLGLDPWFQTSQTPFLLFFGTVTISALYGGTKPGVVATLLSSLLINYFFLEFRQGLSFELANNVRMLLFIIQGCVISYLCGVLRTAQKKTQVSLQQLQTSQKALRESEEQYRQLADNLVDICFWISEPKETRLIYVSPSYERIWGRSCTSLYANFMAWIEAIHIDDRERVQKVFFEQALSGGYDQEYRIVRPDGSIRWIRDRGFPIKDESGEPYRVVGLAEDISDAKQYEAERQQTEIALQETLERLNLAQRAADAGWWDWNILNSYVTWSEEYRELYGLDDAVVPSYKNWIASIFEEDQMRIDYETRQALEDGTELNLEFRVLHPSKGMRWLMAIGRTFLDAEGQPARMTGIALDITDRKRSEEALHKSEAIALAWAKELEAFMETVPAAIWIARDPECHYMNANRAAYELLRVPIGSIATSTPASGEYPFAFKVCKNGHEIPPEDLPMQLAARTKQEVEEEIEFVFSETDISYLYGKAVPLLDESGEVRGAVGAFLDLTERKQMQEALRRREQELSLVTNQVPVLISFVNSQQRYLFNNLTYQKWFGRSSAEVYGKHLREVLGESAYEKILPYVEQVLAGQQVTFESQITYQDAGTRYIEATYIPQLDERGKVEGFVALVSDISDRKRAEEELRRSEERYRYLAEAIPQLVWTADREGRNNYVNQQLCNYIGLECEQLLDFDWRIALHPDDIEPTDHRWMESVQTGIPYEHEYRLRRVDGMYRWHLVRAIPLKDEHNLVVKWFGVSTDIHEQKELEKQRLHLLQQEQAARAEAEKANRIKDEFLAVLSHELRTPLNPIVGWSNLLRTRQWDEQTFTRGLEIIERNAKLQTQLIEDLLDVSRILTGKLSLNQTPVNLVSTIEGAIETVRLAAQAKSIEFQTKLDASVGEILGDATRLQQVLWNLLTNAIKFTPVGGRVEVKLGLFSDRVSLPGENQTRTNYAQITVTDTGKGISPDFLPYVFDYFRQADSATTRKFGGLGLGLAICRYLVEAHGGLIKVDSPGEEQGTTFTVQLPLMGSASPQKAKALESEVLLRLNGFKILIVDDELDSRELLCVMLQELGAQAIAVASAKEALQFISQTKPDLLISDIGMPEIDGYMLLSQIRSLPPELGGNLPAIALTAYAGEIDQQQALAAGYQKHLAKPVVSNQLLQAIAELLAQPHQ